MLRLSKIDILVIALMITVLCLPCCAEAGGFSGLTNAGKTIFKGLRDIIYPASAIGIICVCIGGFFGNINWKWLTAIVIGLIVISLCAGFISMFTPDGAKPDLNG
jgi:type IV secretory pathway VirB2 component (pilin)